MWKIIHQVCGTGIWTHDILDMSLLPKPLEPGQSYKGSTIVNYGSRVIIWGIFKPGTTLESLHKTIKLNWARFFFNLDFGSNLALQWLIL